MRIEIELPLQDSDRKMLRIHDLVLLSGPLIVGRDQVHRLIAGMLDRGDPLPFSLEGETLYYMGPAGAPEGYPIGSCGPTTSERMDAFTPKLLAAGLSGMIGKGPRRPEVVQAIKEHEGVYFAAFGGCGALYATKVVSSEVLAFPMLGPEAALRLQVKDFPVLVAVDCRGNSVY